MRSLDQIFTAKSHRCHLPGRDEGASQVVYGLSLLPTACEQNPTRVKILPSLVLTGYIQTELMTCCLVRTCKHSVLFQENIQFLYLYFGR